MAAGSSAIRAGRAFVELFLDDSKMQRGLRSAAMRLRAFGAQVSGVGRSLIGVGAAVGAPLIAAAKHFASAGDQLGKMSARTGASVEALSELKFAAEQSGSNIETVEKGIKGMARTMYDAERGLSTATDALDDVGVSLDELKGLKPEDQFTLIADRLSAIEDPSRRTALAMKLFGRAGTELIPLFANGADGMSNLREELRRLGGQMTGADAKAAEEFTDAMHELWTQVKAVAFHVGKAVGTSLTDWLRSTQDTIASVIAWTKENQQLIVTVAKIAGVIVGFGGALVGIGSAIQIVAFAISGLAMAVGLFNTVAKASAASTIVLRGGLAGLAIVGIAALAYQLYQTNPALEKFNEQLARSEELARKLAAHKQAQQNEFIAGLPDDPAARRKAITDEQRRLQQELQGLNAQKGNVLKQINEFGWHWAGDKQFEALGQELDEINARLKAAQEYGEQLKGALDGVAKAGKQGADALPGMEDFDPDAILDQIEEQTAGLIDSITAGADAALQAGASINAGPAASGTFSALSERMFGPFRTDYQAQIARHTQAIDHNTRRLADAADDGLQFLP